MKNRPTYNSGKSGSTGGYRKNSGQKGERSGNGFTPRDNNSGKERPYKSSEDRTFKSDRSASEKPRRFSKDEKTPGRFKEGPSEKRFDRKDGERRQFTPRESRPSDRRKTNDRPYSDRPKRFSEDKDNKSFGKRKDSERAYSDRPKKFSKDKDHKPFDSRKNEDRSHSERHKRFSEDKEHKSNFERREVKPFEGKRERTPFKSRGSNSFDKTEKDQSYSDGPKRFEKHSDSSRPSEKEVFKKDKPKRFRDNEKSFDKEEGFKTRVNKTDKSKFTIEKPGRENSFDKPYPLGTRKVSGPFRKKFAEEKSAPAASEENASTQRSNKKELSADKEMTLNKYIAHSGECSRREAAELVKQGKVKVNGQLMLEPGYRVQPDDSVTIAGKKLKPIRQKIYVLLNKPKGYLTTTDDPQGRKTVMELVQGVEVDRLYPVGRLDKETTGLLLLTNDGDLAQKLSHPSYEIKKVYQVTLDKPLTKTDFGKIVNGIDLEDGTIHVDELAYLESKHELGLEIHSGRNRIVRRIFESLGYEVEKLDRVMYAGLTKKNLPRGKWRTLTDKEIIILKHFKQ